LFDFAAGYPHVHKTMYDRPTLHALVEHHGYVRIRFMSRAASEIREINDVEQSEGYAQSLYLEADSP
jgi:hypothetical protein